MSHMSMQAIPDIFPNQNLYDLTSTSTSTPHWVLKLVNDSMNNEELFDTSKYCPKPCTNSTMFRAPTNMRRVDKKAYDPVLASIGPFHYKKPQLQEMEEHKIRFLFGLMRYQRKEEREVRLQRLAEAMKRLEGRPRWCYSDTLL